MRGLWLLPLLLVAAGCKQTAAPAVSAPVARAEIEAVMRDSAAGWNAGEGGRGGGAGADFGAV